MKKVLLISALVLTFTVFMAAQAGSTSNSTPSGQPSAGASGQSGTMGSATSNPNQADQTMPDSTQTSSTAASANANENGKSAKIKGCLSKQGDNFFISDKKHPNGVQLDPGTQDLSAHVGHKVEVKGTWEAAPVSSASTSGAAGTSGGTTGATGEAAAQAGTNPSGAAGTSGSVSGNAGTASASGTMGAASETGSQAIKVDSFKHVADKCDMPADSNAPSTNPK